MLSNKVHKSNNTMRKTDLIVSSCANKNLIFSCNESYFNEYGSKSRYRGKQNTSKSIHSPI